MLSNAKDAWILRGFNALPTNLNHDVILREGSFINLEKLYLPNTIKYIAFCKRFFCFVTYDDLYTINYLQYWVDSEHKAKPMSLDYAEHTYNSQSYLKITSSQKIIGLQATDTQLLALTEDADDESNIYVFKWKLLVEYFFDKPTVYKICVLNNIDYGSIQFLVSETIYGNIVLLYGMLGGTVYLCNLLEGQKSVIVEKAEKLSYFSNDACFLFAVSKESITSKHTYIEYSGFEKNSKTFFIYKHALTKTEESKLLLKKLTNTENKKVLLEITTMTMSKLFIYHNSKNNETLYNNFLFIATTQPNVIYTIIKVNENNYRLMPLIFDPSIDNNMFNKMAFCKKLNFIDTICVANEQLIVFGNTSDESWKVYKFPFFDIPRSKLENNIVFNVQNLFDS